MTAAKKGKRKEGVVAGVAIYRDGTVENYGKEPKRKRHLINEYATSLHTLCGIAYDLMPNLTTYWRYVTCKRCLCRRTDHAR